MVTFTKSQILQGWHLLLWAWTTGEKGTQWWDAQHDRNVLALPALSSIQLLWWYSPGAHRCLQFYVVTKKQFAGNSPVSNWVGSFAFSCVAFCYYLLSLKSFLLFSFLVLLFFTSLDSLLLYVAGFFWFSSSSSGSVFILSVFVSFTIHCLLLPGCLFSSLFSGLLVSPHILFTVFLHLPLFHSSVWLLSLCGLTLWTTQSTSVILHALLRLTAGQSES